MTMMNKLYSFASRAKILCAVRQYFCNSSRQVSNSLLRMFRKQLKDGS